MKKNLFGTDGIRGTVGQSPLTELDISFLGKAIARWAKDKYFDNSKVLIGNDTRESCDKIKEILKKGLSIFHFDIIDAQVIPTPAIVSIVKNSKLFDFALVITASHNPYQHNGIKIIDAKIGKISAKDEEKITELFYLEKNRDRKSSNLYESEYYFDNAKDRYAYLVTQHFKKDLLKDLKIVLDCANGATYQAGPIIFEELGANVVAINNWPNGQNINKNCGSLHPKDLQRAVIENQAHAGFGFDGDGDRIIAVNKDGGIKDGDDILAILANHPKYRYEKMVAGTILTNYAIEPYLAKIGKKLIRTKVGDKFVLQTMAANNLSLGGEQSGHIILRDYLNCSDGIFSAIRLLETVMITGNWQMKSFEKCPQMMVNVPIKEKKNLDTNPFVQIISDHKSMIKNGRIIIRYSGTENLLRVMVEEQDKNAAEAICSNLSNKLEKELNS